MPLSLTPVATRATNVRSLSVLARGPAGDDNNVLQRAPRPPQRYRRNARVRVPIGCIVPHGSFGGLGVLRLRLAVLQQRRGAKDVDIGVLLHRYTSRHVRVGAQHAADQGHSERDGPTNCHSTARSSNAFTANSNYIMSSRTSGSAMADH